LRRSNGAYVCPVAGTEELRVLNVGLSSFADAIVEAGGKASQIEWTPPASRDAAVGRALARLVNHKVVGGRQPQSLCRLSLFAADARRHWAGQVRDPRQGRHMLLHAGPPIPWTRMCGPMQGAIVGAIVWEGWAQDDAGARKLVESGAVRCEPCHDHGAVGPMAGIISPSMPVWIVCDGEHGHRTFSNLNEGLGKALSSGRRARLPGP